MARKGETVSEETRAKMKASHQARWAANRNQYLKACNFVHIGSKRSRSTRKKMSLSHQGYKHKPETIEKIRQASLKRFQQII